MGNIKQERARFVEDRISGMPDEILVSILSLVTLKEAGRASVLSRRWQKLWIFVPNLNFDAQERLYYLDDHRCERGLERLYRIERTKYVMWVNGVLKLHRAPTIDQFRVSFDLDVDYRHDLDHWVKFAFEKRVQRLELSFEHVSSNPCPFPPFYRTLSFPRCNSLRALILKFLNVIGEVLEYFICNCPFLERLCVQNSAALVNLKVPGPLLPLKYLEIRHCHKLQNLEISAKNLVSFVYSGPKITMPFRYVPNLVEMSLGGTYCEYSIYQFCEFSSCLSRLETLILELPRIKWYQSKGGRKVQKAPKCPHHCLKLVEFVGFTGQIIDVEYAMFLIENAVELEKVIIDPRCPLMVGSPWEYNEIEEIQAARECAKMLGRELSLGDKLVIL
ncbi:F-box/LRR-repeat protein At3g58900-like isoform X2 [Alnus glutinosa]|uniref:F-box/LRR-repeat protein At3g58900-like isoform X2 n=1 Tax=Alnus glutinosa TaxID=3517 RepID=UPI002D79F568|nr:F-box/LRR-repeat protein At3g58900-like isoform X2 [Alnus glutinosa]